MSTYTDPLLDASWYSADDQIIRWLRQHPGRKFEPATTPWMLEQIARPGAYVDVGASTGWFAIPFAKRGKKVIAFECNARSVQRLKDNCALNGVEIILHEAAASDRDGSITFSHNPRLPLTSGGSVEHVAANRAREVVPCVQLDSVIDEPVGFIKIDVEGHERAVLTGAERLVEEWRPALMLEANTGTHERLLADWLDARGYTYCKADDRNMLCLPKS